jgi:hypothetical protein
VTSLHDRFGVSERRACRLTSQHRSSQRYRRRLGKRRCCGSGLQLLARRHPRYGYRRIHALLRREGWACNRKRVQRLWRGEGLRLPAKTKRRRRGPRMPGHLTAVCPDQVWAIDFVSDRTADGRPLKILTVTDEDTREALATPVARRMGADDTVSVLERIVERRGRAPKLIRCDNGPRVHQPVAARLVPLQQRRHRLHRAGSTVAESVRRILQRPPPPRAARDGKLQQPVRSAAALGGLAARVQPLPTTPIVELPDTRRVRPPLEDRQPTRTLITSGPKNGVRSWRRAQKRGRADGRRCVTHSGLGCGGRG